jgi:GNAT superfamily N-acetyltransferase
MHEPLEYRKDAYEISTDPARLDVAFIHGFLSRSYWSPGIPEDVVRRAILHSLCYGVYHEGRQVGFARVVTDHATFAYLADVFVIEAHRGRGLSKWLMACILAHPGLQGLRSWMLATRDAHGLYARFGFRTVDDPSTIMRIYRPDVYRAGA